VKDSEVAWPVPHPGAHGLWGCDTAPMTTTRGIKVAVATLPRPA
jgi:hypothetical protein